MGEVSASDHYIGTRGTCERTTHPASYPGDMERAEAFMRFVLFLVAGGQWHSAGIRHTVRTVL